MKHPIRTALLAIVAFAAAFGAITWWALESKEVVVLRTFDTTGTPRTTRVWIAVDEAGVPWLEAANPERPWLHDVLAHPEIELDRTGAEAGSPGGARTERWRAEPVPDPEGHTTVRRLLREKYGPRDVWVGLLVDTSRSEGVRLHPIEAAP